MGVITYSNIITWLTIITVIVNCFSHWKLSQGEIKLVYKLNMFVFSGYFLIETLLAIHDKDQQAIILFSLMDVVAFSMALRGYWRTRK